MNHIRRMSCKDRSKNKYIVSGAPAWWAPDRIIHFFIEFEFRRDMETIKKTPRNIAWMYRPMSQN